MKTLFKLPMTILYLIVLVSCSTDPPEIIPGKPQAKPPVPDEIPNDPDENNGESGENDDDPGENDNGNNSNIYFGFLDGDSSSETFIDMPIESSATHLFVGRWKIIKIGLDENNDGKEKFYNYKDYDHIDCGYGFLQFNNDGFVFENVYYKNEDTCKLFVEYGKWELIEKNRFKIYVYDILYIVKMTDSELVLKYDWRFENSLYAPAQVYYYYERILPSD